MVLTKERRRDYKPKSAKLSRFLNSAYLLDTPSTALSATGPFDYSGTYLRRDPTPFFSR